jgi:hypothetical protein
MGRGVTGRDAGAAGELHPAAQELLDAYLDELFGRLGGEPRTRRLLVECEEHLRAATLTGMAAGLEPVAAARAAIARLGPRDLVVRAYAPTTTARWVAELLVRLASFAVLLAAGALLAIGVAGVVAGVGAIAAGPRFVAGNAPSAGASAADCARLQGLYPGTPNCAAAAAQDAVNDVLMGAAVAGVLGGVLAAEGRRQLPVAALTFVCAALWDLLFFHFDTLPATVPVALALVIAEALRLRRCIRPRPGASTAS